MNINVDVSEMRITERAVIYIETEATAGTMEFTCRIKKEKQEN